MELTFKEIYHYKDKNFEQIISLANEAIIFKIETIYADEFKIDKKVTLLDRFEAKAISRVLEAVENEEKAS